MPIYAYKCSSCGHEKDVLGWYATDFKNGSAKPNGKPADSKPDGDAKPAAEPAAKPADAPAAAAAAPACGSGGCAACT